MVYHLPPSTMWRGFIYITYYIYIWYIYLLIFPSPTLCVGGYSYTPIHYIGYKSHTPIQSMGYLHIPHLPHNVGRGLIIYIYVHKYISYINGIFKYVFPHPSHSEGWEVFIIDSLTLLGGYTYIIIYRYIYIYNLYYLYYHIKYTLYKLYGLL